jgi:hypothetical protein
MYDDTPNTSIKTSNAPANTTTATSGSQRKFGIFIGPASILGNDSVAIEATANAYRNFYCLAKYFTPDNYVAK